jgi:hypothetical protein
MSISFTFEGQTQELISLYQPPNTTNEQFLNFSKMIKLGKFTTIAGDINIDHLIGENSDIFAHFCAAGCGPIIDQPTRITEKSASCIDHIFTPMINVTGFVLECDVSDHHAVGLLPIKITKLKNSRKEVDMPLQDK